MGVAGAAAATVIAQGVSAVLVTVRLMHFHETCDFSFRKIRIDGDMLKRELLLGLPGGTQAAMYSISNIIVTAAINGFGELTVASWTAYTKLDGLFWMISGAMGVTITTFVGQNFGAGKMDRIRKGVRVMNWAYVAVALLMSVLVIGLRETLFHIFVDSREAVEIGCRMLLIISPFYLINIYIENYSGALRGVGDTLMPMLFSVFGICIFRILYLGLFFPMYPTLEVLCAMYPVSWALTNTLYMIYYPIRMRKLGMQ
jgi:Na+-driven multidrug efflux pump